MLRNIQSSVFRYYFAGSNREKIEVMTFKIKLEKTTEIKFISKSPIEFVVGPSCPENPPQSYTMERIWIYKVKVLPKPPVPKLVAERHISPGTIKLSASGCPTNVEGYDYQLNASYCSKEATEIFYTMDKSGKFEGIGDVNYRVRCATNNGTCASKPSEFTRGITYNPPELTCPPQEHRGQINFIESIKQTGG